MEVLQGELKRIALQYFIIRSSLMSTNYFPNMDAVAAFSKGTNYDAYHILGAHRAVIDGVEGYSFAVWAPEVKSVRVTGEFCAWSTDAHYMTCMGDSGVWCAFLPGLKKGELYKYVIETQDGSLSYKADPYAVHAEMRPGTASVTWELGGYKWGDSAWMKRRKKASHFDLPMNIYEVHLGSWRRPLGENGEPAGDFDFYTYRELADQLAPYVKHMGYTHIELMPVTEHPFDGSWGYQATGYFAPTSRYGTPQDFMYMVDTFHRMGISVITDWVPGHFCRDAHGLARFNGKKLYEDMDHKQWGTSNFDYSRPEVRSFLISGAMYWLGEYHIDGIRVDGVSSMLYLNFGVDEEKEKRFNIHGDEGNLAAIDFIKELNSAIALRHPDVCMIAEESTAWPLVTYPPKDGGLGFHYKWDMGWMNDTLNYCRTDFPYRKQNHTLLSFSMMYAFSENYILPLSHDEVVHGKASLIGRQPGDISQQFAGVRLLSLYQMTHSGAKLSFMGSEIAQFIEWRYYEELEWFLLEYENHRSFQSYIKTLNETYLETNALWERSYSHEGFEWIDADNADQNIFSYIRRGKDSTAVVVLNFGLNSYDDYLVGVPENGYYKEILNTDDEKFGGSGHINPRALRSSTKKPMHGKNQSVKIKIPALGGVILRYNTPRDKTAKKQNKK